MKYLSLLLFTTLSFSLLGQDSFEDNLQNIEPVIYAPNSFTPDNDGVNDVWRVITDFSWEEFEVSVFNQWGEIVWACNSPEDCWNGECRGGSYYSPDGEYYYVARARNGEHTEYKKGVIHMIR